MARLNDFNRYHQSELQTAKNEFREGFTSVHDSISNAKRVVEGKLKLQEDKLKKDVNQVRKLVVLHWWQQIEQKHSEMVLFSYKHIFLLIKDSILFMLQQSVTQCMALGERQKLYGSVTLLTVFRSPDWMNIIIYSFSFPVEAVVKLLIG